MVEKKEESNDLMTYGLIAGGVVLAGAAFWYLSGNNFNFDFEKVHTKEQLCKLLEEYALDSSEIIVRSYNAMLKNKERGNYSKKSQELKKIFAEQQMDCKLDMLLHRNGATLLNLDQFSTKFNFKTGKYISGTYKQYHVAHKDGICKGINREGFGLWLAHFKDDEQVKKITKIVGELTYEFNKYERISCMGFKNDLPEQLNHNPGQDSDEFSGQQMHMQISQKLWAKLRHELYNKCHEELSANNTNKKGEHQYKLTREEVNKVYQDQVLPKIDIYRKEVYNLMLDKNELDPSVVKTIMRKSYIVHAALAFDGECDHNHGDKSHGKQDKDSGKPAERSFFAIYARVAETQHNRYINEFCNWNFYDNIKVDPLESKDPDEKIVLSENNALPGIQRQSTQNLQAQLKEQNAGKGLSRVITRTGKHVIEANEKALKVIREYVRNWKAKRASNNTVLVNNGKVL